MEKSRFRSNYIALAVLAVVLAILPFILGNAYYIGVAVFIGIYCLITIGLSLLMGYAGQISLGHAAFYAIGAYTSGLLTRKAGLSPWLALVIAVALAAVIAFLIAIPTLRLKGHYLAMATLGFGEIVHIFLNAEINLTGGPSGLTSIPRLKLGSLVIKSQMSRYFLVWGIVLIVLLLALNIIHSRVGRALRSIHGSEVAAQAMGVDVFRYKIQIFVLSGALAAIAGSLYAHFVRFISPGTFDLNFSILVVMMVVVGGMSSIWGALMGTVLLGVLPELLRGFRDYDVLIYGGILLIILLFAPDGVFGLGKKLRGLIRFRKGESVGNATSGSH